MRKRDDDKAAEKKKQNTIADKSQVVEHGADGAKFGMKRPASALKVTKGGVEATVVTNSTPCPKLGASPLPGL